MSDLISTAEQEVMEKNYRCVGFFTGCDEIVVKDGRPVFYAQDEERTEPYSLYEIFEVETGEIVASASNESDFLDLYKHFLNKARDKARWNVREVGGTVIAVSTHSEFDFGKTSRKAGGEHV